VVTKYVTLYINNIRMEIRSAVHCFFNYEILGKVCYDMIGGEHL